MSISSDRTSRRRHLAALISASAGLTGLALLPNLTTAQTGTVSGKRAAVEALQSKLDAISSDAERATEAYNGAVYHLQVAKDRIRQNTDLIHTSQQKLQTSRTRLADRLRSIYASPPPTLVQVVIDSGSVTDAMDSVAMFQRISQQDGATVDGIKKDLTQLATARVQLVKDQADAKTQTDEASKRRSEVLANLNRERDLLSSAKADLRHALVVQHQQELAAIQQQKAALAQQQAAANAQSGTPTSDGTTPQTSAGVAAPGSGAGNAAVVAIAERYLGTPYVWGGAAPGGFDCSGLASYVYAQIGISMPHYTGAIFSMFPQVSYNDLQAGDLVFFHSDHSHMGIYIGNGQFIHAPHTGDVVKISSLAEHGDFSGAVRP
ncbi:MAG: NlpC/P60 family protein [Thermoleophilia bacterium]